MTEEIILRTLCTDQLERFATWLTEDDEWRNFAGKNLSALEWLHERSAAQSLGWGETRGVFLQSGEVAGLITADWVDEAWTGGTSLLECGTYLFKSFRGMGLNANVKSATLEFTANVLHASWVVYVVPVSNVPAVQSLRKQFPMNEYPFLEGELAHRGGRVERGERRDYSEAVRKRFADWIRYREWKEGTKLTLFAIPLTVKNR